MDQATIALLITLIVIILFVTEWLPVAVTAILSAIAMAAAGIIPLSSALSGLGNNVVLFVFGMSVIGAAMFETGGAQFIGDLLAKRFRRSERAFLLLMIVCAAIFSAFLSNTAVIVLFMNIISSVAAQSNGKITKKNTYMAVGIATVAGGAATLIGSTAQMTAQGILVDYGGAEMKLFTLSAPGIPVILALVLYYYFWGYRRSTVVFDFPERQDVLEGQTKTYQPGLKMWLPVVIMLACIVVISLGVWPAGVVAVMGACCCVITGCISQKKMFESTDWTTIFVIAGSLGFAQGVDKSGAGTRVAEWLMQLFGENANPWVLFAVLVVLATIMTNVMTNISTVSIMLPIALSVAQQQGLNMLPFAVGIAWASNMPFSTPIGANPITMTMTAGYRFRDYLKVGMPYNVISCLLVILIVPLVFPL